MVCNVVQSSSAGFTISAAGQNLEQTDETSDIPAYRLQMKVGQTVTLVSQGRVMPRGAPSGPGEPDAGAWLFDDTVFQLRPHEKNLFDKTKLPIALKALKNPTGQTRVRFVGNILGYDRKYDVLIEIVG